MADPQQPRRPSLLRRLWLWFTDTVYLRLLGGVYIKRYYRERTQTFVTQIIKCLSKDVPYVIEGKWRWCQTEGGYHPSLTLVLPELGLVCMSWGPEVGRWSEAKLYCKNRGVWEYANQIAALVEIRCREHGFLYLPLYWDDPVDPATLKLKLSNLLDAGNDNKSED